MNELNQLLGEIKNMLVDDSDPVQWLAEMKQQASVGEVPDWFAELCDELGIDGDDRGALFSSCIEQLLKPNWKEEVVWVFPDDEAATKYDDLLYRKEGYPCYPWDTGGGEAYGNAWALPEDNVDEELAKQCGAEPRVAKVLRGDTPEDRIMVEYLIFHALREDPEAQWIGWTTDELVILL